MKLTTGVNFINVKRTNFLYRHRFSSYVLALSKKLYKKFAGLTLMNLTIGERITNHLEKKETNVTPVRGRALHQTEISKLLVFGSFGKVRFSKFEIFLEITVFFQTRKNFAKMFGKKFGINFLFLGQKTLF